MAALQDDRISPVRKFLLRVLPATMAGAFSLPAQAHSGPPVSLILGSLWGALAYVLAAALFVLASKDGRRLRRFLLCVAFFPVWWCVVEFSVVPFLDYPPWDMAVAILAPLAILVYAVRYLARVRDRGHKLPIPNR